MMATYTHDSRIATKEEAKDFFRHIVFDLDINFHPDDDFKEYISRETGERTMDDAQAELYNRLMDEAFGVFNDEEELYEMACGVLEERINGIN